jgi:Flp pilus assembly pilin Flp
VKRSEEGAALVEFCVLAVVLLVPLVYLVVVAARVQNAAFAVTAAVRDAGRAYALAPSDALGRARAELAAQVALTGDAVTFQQRDLVVTCGSCQHRPGSWVTVSLDVPVPLPWLPFFSLRGFPVRAHFTERLGCFVPGRAAGC